jgi:hypothetical protein
MQINKKCGASSGDFWYDLTDGGYLDPNKICKKKEDAERVIAAISIVKEFQTSCEEQIEDFIQ